MGCCVGAGGDGREETGGGWGGGGAAAVGGARDWVQVCLAAAAWRTERARATSSCHHPTPPAVASPRAGVISHRAIPLSDAPLTADSGVAAPRREGLPSRSRLGDGSGDGNPRNLLILCCALLRSRKPSCLSCMAGFFRSSPATVTHWNGTRHVPERRRVRVGVRAAWRVRCTRRSACDVRAVRYLRGV